MSAAAPAQTILIVEDDAKIADMLANYLHMHGFQPAVCANGNDAVAMVQTSQPVLMLLDLMLPGLDGMAVCSAVRAFSTVPIIMVTARVDEIDRLIGLETGADDYVCKPFSPREVVDRVKTLLRRTQGGRGHCRVSVGRSAAADRQAGRATAANAGGVSFAARTAGAPWPGVGTSPPASSLSDLRFCKAV
jgi:two-component system response regulator BaeR